MNFTQNSIAVIYSMLDFNLKTRAGNKVDFDMVSKKIYRSRFRKMCTLDRFQRSLRALINNEYFPDMRLIVKQGNKGFTIIERI